MTEQLLDQLHHESENYGLHEDVRALLREAADKLRAALEDGLESEFGEGADVMDFNIQLLEELDDITMQCEGCGWWCETGFLNDAQICDDCEDE